MRTEYDAIVRRRRPLGEVAIRGPPSRPKVPAPFGADRTAAYEIAGSAAAHTRPTTTSEAGCAHFTTALAGPSNRRSSAGNQSF